MKVYIVREGERYEASSVVGAFDSYEKAFRFVSVRLLEVAKDWDAQGRLQHNDPDEHNFHEDDFGLLCRDYWVFGGDYITIDDPIELQ